MPFARQPLLTRPAFTLIEILVTIAIILILAGLSFWGVNAVIGGRQRNNTIATLKVLNNTLQAHWKYVVDESKKETPSLAVQALAAPDPTGERARVLWAKVRLMEAFPLTFAEILGKPKKPPFVYDPAFGPSGALIPTTPRYISDYANQLNSQLTAPAKTSTQSQSSACLRLALSISRGGNALTDEQIKYALADTDGDGVLEIIDSFTAHPPVPLAFFRFPWNNANLQAANPGAANSRNKKVADPEDTGGTMLNPGWLTSKQRTAFEAIFFAVTWPQLPNNATAAQAQQAIGSYVVPVIVSAGADGQFGLNVDVNGLFLPDMSVANPALANDNFYSFQLN